MHISIYTIICIYNAMSVTVDEEIIKRLPKSFQIFYEICMKAGLKPEEKVEGNKNESEQTN